MEKKNRINYMKRKKNFFNINKNISKVNKNSEGNEIIYDNPKDNKNKYDQRSFSLKTNLSKISSKKDSIIKRRIFRSDYVGFKGVFYKKRKNLLDFLSYNNGRKRKKKFRRYFFLIKSLWNRKKVRYFFLCYSRLSFYNNIRRSARFELKYFNRLSKFNLFRIFKPLGFSLKKRLKLAYLKYKYYYPYVQFKYRYINYSKNLQLLSVLKSKRLLFKRFVLSYNCLIRNINLEDVNLNNNSFLLIKRRLWLVNYNNLKLLYRLQLYPKSVKNKLKLEKFKNFIEKSKKFKSFIRNLKKYKKPKKFKSLIKKFKKSKKFKSFINKLKKFKLFKRFIRKSKRGRKRFFKQFRFVNYLSHFRRVFLRRFKRIRHFSRKKYKKKKLLNLKKIKLETNSLINYYLFKDWFLNNNFFINKYYLVKYSDVILRFIIQDHLLNGLYYYNELLLSKLKFYDFNKISNYSKFVVAYRKQRKLLSLIKKRRRNKYYFKSYNKSLYFIQKYLLYDNVVNFYLKNQFLDNFYKDIPSPFKFGKIIISLRYNNIFVTLLNINNKVIYMLTGGKIKFYGSRRRSNYCREKVISKLGEVAKSLNFKVVDVYLKFFSKRFNFALKKSLVLSDLNIRFIFVDPRLSHGFLRPKKLRRK